MESKWLEDFISLAETRSFSRSAALRHVTQPAFSRRIQALEAWLGVELVDRSGYPTRLTAAGNIFHAQALALLHQTQEARAQLRGLGAATATTIEFAMPHTLSLTYFPTWMQTIDARIAAQSVTSDAATDGATDGASARLRARLQALNVHDAVLRLTEGGCDLMMGYHHASHPMVLDPRRYAYLTLGTETVSPFCAPAPRADSRPRFTLPGTPQQPVPYLAYSPSAYLQRITEVLLMRAPGPLFLDPIYETDMAEGLKLMALSGHGIAFLPHSAAADAVAAGRLVPVDGPKAAHGDATLSLTMEIRLYRDKFAETGAARQALLDAVWLAAQDVLDMSGTSD